MTPIYKQKTFWSGLATMLTGAGMCVMGDTATGMQTILGGLAIIFMRQAIEKNGPSAQ